MLMRISVGILATATALFVGGASGVLGTWALVSATLLGLIGAVTTVTVMEGREYAHATVTTVTTVADRRRPLSATDLQHGQVTSSTTIKMTAIGPTPMKRVDLRSLGGPRRRW